MVAQRTEGRKTGEEKQQAENRTCGRPAAATTEKRRQESQRYMCSKNRRARRLALRYSRKKRDGWNTWELSLR